MTAAPAPPPPPVAASGAKASTLAAAKPVQAPSEALDEEGNQLTTLQFLQRAVESYERIRPGTATADSEGWPELTDLGQLVKFGVVKSLPSAPSGQKFVFDPKTQKVGLTRQ